MRSFATTRSEPTFGRAFRLLAAASALTLVLTACDDDDPVEVTDDPTLTELVVESDNLTSLEAAVTAAGLATTLDEDGPFTVFAPIDAAFAALGTERVDRLLAEGNEALLTKVLTFHVVPGEILAEDIEEGATLTTLEGSELTFSLADGARVNGVRIIETDIQAGNGVVHLVEGVLTQNLDIVDVATLEGFPTLVAAVQAAGLEATLRSNGGGDGFTVFAPTEAAFSAIAPLPTDPDVLEDILLYHAVPGRVPSSALSDEQVVTTAGSGTFEVSIGSGVAIVGNQNQAGVILTDVPASNGVIHVIDTVLLP